MTNPNISANDAAHFDNLRDQWWNRDGELRTLHQINPIRLHYVTANSKHLQSKRLLDVGCGGGIFAESLARVGFQVSAIDVNQSAIEVARAHAAEQQLAITYTCSTIEQYRPELPVFDIVTCMELLEHVPDPASVLAHCANLLAPGGMLFASTLNRTLRSFATAIVGAEYVLGMLPKGTHQYQRFLKPSELTDICDAYGMALSGSCGIGYNPITQQMYTTDDVSVNYMLCFTKQA